LYTSTTGWDQELYDVTLKDDGSIVAVGTMYHVDRYRFLVQRVTSTGQPGGFNSFEFDDDAAAYGVAQQPDGKMVVVGTCETNFGDMAVIRIKADLSLDQTFSGDGKDLQHFTFGRDEARDVVVQPDGKIVVAGWLHRDSGVDEMALLRYTTAGTLDPAFNTYGYVSASYGGWDTYGMSVALNSEGNIVVGGYSSSSVDLFVSARFVGNENQVFADGFEYGSTDVWSATTP